MFVTNRCMTLWGYWFIHRLRRSKTKQTASKKNGLLLAHVCVCVCECEWWVCMILYCLAWFHTSTNSSNSSSIHTTSIKNHYKIRRSNNIYRMSRHVQSKLLFLTVFMQNRMSKWYGHPKSANDRVYFFIWLHRTACWNQYFHSLNCGCALW